MADVAGQATSSRELCALVASKRPGPRRAARDPGRESSSSAARLLLSWSTVAAPLSTTSAHGWASTAASASASGVLPERSASSCNGLTSPRAVSRPLASASLTITPRPAACAASSAGPCRALEQVPGRLHCVEAPTSRARSIGLALVRSGGGQPDRQTRLAQPSELAEHLSVVENPALERGRMDLVDPEIRSEQGAALGNLPSQCGEREILDLVHLGVDAPVGGVGVAHLEPTVTAPGSRPRRSEPGGEELLRLAVRAGGVEVADAAVVRGVEDRVRLPLERGDVLLRRRGRRRDRGLCSPDGRARRDRGRAG